MKGTNRLAAGIAGLALLSGILGDALLRTRAGINVFLWIAALALAALWLARRGGVPLSGEGRWLALPVCFLAAAVAWRDSATLRALDFLALALTLSLAALQTRTGQIRQAEIMDYALAMAAGGANILFGPFLLLFSDISLKGAPRGRWAGPAAGLARGLLIALPLLLLFGILLVAADAAFERLISSLFTVDFPRLLSHLALILFLAWLAGGLLRSLFLAEAPRTPTPAGTPFTALSLGMVEVATVLGSLNALFLAFVAVQFRYFFGGAGWVQTATGLTYAEYARRGFFELVAVAALLLPVLLAAHWLLRGASPRHQRLFRVLAGALVATLALIMASAFHRLWLYQSAYGLTEPRLYAAACMVWLALVFLWFCATVLRGHRNRFAFGVLVSGLALLAMLHGLNPDAVIARANLRHMQATGRFDAYYAVMLSADSVPVLVENLSSLPPEQRQVVVHRLRQRWGGPAQEDWRSWNWGRAKARQVVRDNQAAMKAAVE